MSYIILSGRRCNIIVLNVRTPSEEKGNDVKDSFYEDVGVYLIKVRDTILRFAV
jgi:hypothetical protein